MTEAGFTTLGVVDTPFYQVNGYQYDRGFNYFYDMKSQLLGTPHYSVVLTKSLTKESRIDSRLLFAGSSCDSRVDDGR